jgi:hypothetical protein
MSICEKDIVKLPFTEEVILEDIKKDFGLLNISNVNTTLNVCQEIFNGPTYTTNLTKLQTGLTETSIGVFNITNSDMSLNYTFTGNTNTLTAYTGNFEYEVYKRTDELIPPEITSINGLVQTDVQNFTKRRVYRGSAEFSGITSSGFTGGDLFDFVEGDQEYILNSNFSFFRKDCSKKTKYIEPNIKYRYDDKSFYFVTLLNPSTPILGPFRPVQPRSPEILTVTRRETTSELGDTFVFGVPSRIDVDNKCCLKVEKLPISLPNSNIFTINGIPSPNSLMISVNGITLSTDDYGITDKTVIKLVQPLFPNKDIITATYVECGTDIETIHSEQFEIMSAITSGVTSGVTSTDRVYYNTEKTKYEYYMEYQADEPENIILYLNGIKLTYGLDFYISTTINNRIIFDNINLSISDILYLVYVTDGSLSGDYDLINSDTNLEWDTITPVVVNDRLNGEFLLEITTPSDINFTSTGRTQVIIPFEDGVSLYSSGIPTTLEANKNYIWRVTSNKIYFGLLGNIFNTYNISILGKFFTNNKINSY